MRNFQTKTNKSGLPDSITTTRFGAGEFNALATELENAVTSSDQTLAPADGTGEVSTQLSMAMSIYGAGGAAYHIDTGAVNAYVLNPIVPIESPPAYFDGFTVMFEPGTVNTGASTVNIASIGSKSITTTSGAALSGGEISGTTIIKYNLANDRFEYIYNSDIASITATQTYYLVDSSQADQGATSADPDTYTLYDIATLVGTGKHATATFIHNPSAGNQTYYIFDTSLDLSSYPFLKLDMENGAEFNRTTGDEILTLYDSESLMVGKRQQLTTVDMLAFANDSIGYPQWWGAKADGSTDDSAAIQYCLTNCRISETLPTNYSYLVSNQGTEDGYDIALTIPTGHTLKGYGWYSKIQTSDDTIRMLIIDTKNHVTIKGIHFYGGYAGSGVSDVGNGILVQEADYIEILDCYFGYISSGVYVQVSDSLLSSNIKINNNYSYYNGFQSLTITGDVTDTGTANMNTFEILNNRVYNNAYLTGICVQYGCTNGIVNNNNVHTTNEHGILIDTCQDITVTGNRVSYCTNGGITVAQTGASVCEQITVTGNTATYCGSANPSQYGGFYITAKTGAIKSCILSGNNSCYNYGNGVSISPTSDSTADMYGVEVVGNYIAWNTYNGIELKYLNSHGVNDISLISNKIRANTRNGITMYGAYNIDVSNNACSYNDSGNTSTYVGVEVAASCSYVVVAYNRMFGSVQTYGVRVNTGASNTYLSYNHWFGNKTGTYTDAGTGTTLTGNI